MNALNHPHPGELIRDEILAPLGLSIQEAAEMVHVPSQALAQVLEGQAGITPDLAERLASAGFSTGRFWVALQAAYDRLGATS